MRLLISVIIVGSSIVLQIFTGAMSAYASSSYTTAVLADSPIGYWPLDDPSGSATVADLSGNNYTGTVDAGVTLGNSPGPITLSPNNLYAATAGSGPLATTSAPQTSAVAWSDEIWFKTTQTGNSVLLSDRNMSGGGAGMSLSLEIGGSPISAAPGSIGFGLDSNAIWIGVQTNSAYNDGKWHYAVGVWSAPSGAAISPSQFTIYIDGVAAATSAHSTGSGTSPLSGSGGETIGAQNNGALAFSGDLARAAIYGSALSSSRVLAHYHAAGTIIQQAPFSTIATAGNTYSSQLNVSGASGTVSYVVTSSSPQFGVSSTGAISAPSTLSAGSYIVSGTDSDTSGDEGVWSFTLTVAAPGTAYNTAVLGNHPIAYWPLNDASGSATVADLSGNGYTGTVGAGVTLGNSPGPIVSSSNNLYAATVGSGPLATTPAPQTSAVAWSDEIWFKTTQTGNSVLLSDRNMSGGGGGMSLSLEIGGSPIAHAPGSIGFGLDSNSIWIGVQTNSAYNDGNWHYAVGVWSAPSGTAISPSQFTIYIDGSAVSTVQESTNNPPNSPLSGSAGETIGAQNNGALAYSGDLAGAAIYGTALSSSSVSTHYQAATAGTITQIAPFSGITSVGVPFSDQLNVTGSTGTLSYTITSASPAFSVSSTGGVTAPSTLSAGTYVVSGTDADTSGDSGTWTFTLSVKALGTYGSAVVSDNPIAYWPLNDAAGSSTVVDESGHGYAGTVGTGVTLGNSPGPITTSSNNLYAATAGSGPLATTPAPQTSAVAWSDEIWFKTTQTGNSVLLSDRNMSGGGAGMSLSLEIGGSPISNAAGSIGFGLDSNGIWIGVQTNSAYNDGIWHYAVGVWSAPSGTAISPSQFTIYIDGVAAATSAHSTGSGTSPLSGSAGETLGAQNNGALAFSGDLARAAIYGSALSSSTVLTHYDAGEGKISQIAPTSATTTVGTSFTDQLNVTGASGTVTYVVTSASPAFSVSSTGAVSAPGTLSSGTYTVSGTDSDTSGNSGAWTFTLIEGQSPVITSASSTTFSAGLVNSFNVTVAAGTYPSATITDTAFSGCSPSTLPTGVSLSTSGTLSSTASLVASGTYTICLTASNGIGTNGTQSFSLTVQWDDTGFATLAQQNEAGDFYGVAYDGANIISVGDDNSATYGEVSYEAGVSGSDWNVVDDFNSLTVTASDGAGIISGPLYAVSCPSSAVCVAVGQNSTLTGAQILFTTSSPTAGASWSNATIPAGIKGLYSVSCPTPSVCFAVGDGSGGGAILASTNGGSSWSTNSGGSDTLPTNLGVITSLYGITCLSTSDCNAVGAGINGGADDGAFLYYNGTAWTTQNYSSSGGELSGITCTSSSVCIATGYGGGSSQIYTTSSATSATGGWSVSASWPGTGSYLYAVACLSSTNCYAVGWSAGSGWMQVTTNGGSSWSTRTISDGEISWYAIVCPPISPNACTTVGSNGLSTFYPVAVYGS